VAVEQWFGLKVFAFESGVPFFDCRKCGNRQVLRLLDGPLKFEQIAKKWAGQDGF